MTGHAKPAAPGQAKYEAEAQAAFRAFLAAPTHLIDKATWEDRAEPAMPSFVTDVLNDATRERYAGLVMVETWSVYRYGFRLFTVNPDGTLRAMREWVDAVEEFAR